MVLIVWTDLLGNIKFNRSIIDAIVDVGVGVGVTVDIKERARRVEGGGIKCGAVGQ
jgi:hypothetical protein